MLENTAIQTPLGPLQVRVGGAGPATVFWHSAYVDSHSFDRLIPLLPGRRLVLIDGPCHGRSPAPPEEFDLEDCADCAEAVIDALELGPVDWVGSAWGGHTGVVLAARDSGRLRSLAAICSPMHPVEAATGPRILAAAFPQVGFRGPIRSGLLGALLDPDRRAADPTLEQYVAGAISVPDRRGLALAMRSIVLGRPSLVERLDRITVPTLFATGDNPLWTVEQARAQVERVPGGRFAHLPGVRHLPPLEDPAACAALLVDFWG